MTGTRWAEDPDGRFRVRIPEGWEAAVDDEQGGIELEDPEGLGALHLLSFAAGGESEDPADELYSFLADQDIEIEEEDVEDLALPSGGAMALTEFITEDEEEASPAYWLMGVALGPGALVFATYSCDAEAAEDQRDRLFELLRTLDLSLAALDGPSAE